MPDAHDSDRPRLTGSSPQANFVYLVADEATKTCAVIDACWDGASPVRHNSSDTAAVMGCDHGARFAIARPLSC